MRARAGKTLGPHLQQLRENGGLTQQDVATALDVSVAAVSKWENDRMAPSVAHTRALSDLYCVPLQALVRLRRQTMYPTAKPKPTKTKSATRLAVVARRPRARARMRTSKFDDQTAQLMRDLFDGADD